MKAVFFRKHGGPEVLEVGELPDPVPGHREVCLDVAATSINHLDLFVRRGMPGIEIPFPHVPGCDVAGVVSAIGPGVEGVEVGQRVVVDPTLSCGECDVCARGDASMCRKFGVLGEHVWGACAEKVVVPARNLIALPAHISFEEAASLPLVFVTAWRMLVTRGRLRAGEDILILGAAAGVGAASIQIAKRAGARVFAAAGSEKKLEFCRALGADILIDYNEEDFVRRVRTETDRRGVDVVVDYVGSDTWVRSLKTLARGGRLLTCGATTGYDPQTDLRYIFYNQLEIIGSTMGNRDELVTPLMLVFRGEMKPTVGRVCSLEETADGHRALEARQVIGKIVVRVG